MLALREQADLVSHRQCTCESRVGAEEVGMHLQLKALWESHLLNRDTAPYSL